jgi:hypothetical protein
MEELIIYKSWLYNVNLFVNQLSPSIGQCIFSNERATQLGDNDYNRVDRLNT